MTIRRLADGTLWWRETTAPSLHVASWEGAKHTYTRVAYQDGEPTPPIEMTDARAREIGARAIRYWMGGRRTEQVAPTPVEALIAADILAPEDA